MSDSIIKCEGVYKIFGEGDELVAKMKIEEERIAQAS